MPMGVFKSRVADTGSRNIFFVAACRSLGIPARIEPVARKVQYMKDGNWMDVDFEAAVQTTAKQGKVVASYAPIKALQDPKYYSHFTIAKILPSAKLQTLNFERTGNVDMGVGDTWSSMLKTPLSMDEGNYMMVTGTRMANGSVLAEVSFLCGSYPGFSPGTDKPCYARHRCREEGPGRMGPQHGASVPG